MAKTTKAQAKDQKKPAAEGNRYTRAARVLAKDDIIDVAALADRLHERNDGGALPRSVERVRCG
jgi:hypothetical protein